MENNIQKRAEEIVKQFTQIPSMKTTGHFAVNTNVTYNMLKSTNMTFDKAMETIFRIHMRELSQTPGLYDAIVELVQKEMQPEEEKTNSFRK